LELWRALFFEMLDPGFLLSLVLPVLRSMQLLCSFQFLGSAEGDQSICYIRFNLLMIASMVTLLLSVSCSLTTNIPCLLSIHFYGLY
jgi:hypothetical protein